MTTLIRLGLCLAVLVPCPPAVAQATSTELGRRIARLTTPVDLYETRFVDEMSKSLGAELGKHSKKCAAHRARCAAKLKEVARELISYEEFVVILSKAYEFFSEAEKKELIAFFETPTGRKFAQKGALMSQLVAGDPEITALVEGRIEEALQRHGLVDGL